jgi:hypothetical protein
MCFGTKISTITISFQLIPSWLRSVASKIWKASTNETSENALLEWLRKDKLAK